MKERRTNKVLHIISGLGDGGAEGVLTRLCLHSKKNQHVVISLIDEGKYGAVLSGSGVTVHCLNMSPGKPSLFKFLKLVRLIKAEEPEVVQTWMYHADFLGGIAAKLAGIKRIFWGVRMSALERGKSRDSTVFIARLCALLSKFIPKKIVCCANKALRAHADIGYAPEKLLVIPNGYDLELFKPNVTAGTEIRVELKLFPEEFVIGKVGRFDPLKDHFNLLEALALVVNKQIRFKCLLIGKDLSPQNNALINRIAELGLKNHVILVGQRVDIPAVMNALDLHVLSSCSEGFPNVIAEAMACGTPCISTDVGDALDIIGNNQALCPPRNPQALAELITKMVNEYRQNPTEWQARKVTCVQRVADNFSIQAMVDAYEACWFSDFGSAN